MMQPAGRTAAFVLLLLLLAVVLASCGYRLVGQGGGAIPAGVSAIVVQGIGEMAQPLEYGLKQEFIRGGLYDVVPAASAEGAADRVIVRIDQVSDQFMPSAYDRLGIAIQYRMTLSANVRIYRSGKLIWQSGLITKSGDLFVTGGPADIEASKQRITKDLGKEWIATAWGRINSGF